MDMRIVRPALIESAAMRISPDMMIAR